MFMIYKIWILASIAFTIFWIKDANCHEIKRISVLEVTSIEGNKAALPCDVKHPKGDNVFLVLWFNDNQTTPIYSYDIRPGVRDSVNHWKDNTVLGDRANLIVSDRVAELQLDPVQEIDEGFYKCRVDFRQHPTRTTRISLKVIVPPKSLVINQDGEVVTSVIGPFQEGDSTSLKCTAYGGRPTPNVYWYFGDHIIDDEMDSELEPQEPEVVTKIESTRDRKLRSLPQWKLRRNRKATNTLTLGPFDRNDLKKLVTCEASNSNLSKPISEAVMVDMNLPPLGMFISGPNEAISAGKTYTLVCQVTGSRPPPSISWFKGSTRVQGESVVTSTDGNITKSSLTLVPHPPDDGTTITCTAKNQATQSFLQKSLAITVNFVPEAVVKLASFLKPHNIKEGDDVYFECSITANPKVYKITWQHNGKILEPNVSGGIIVSNHSLVLQKVKRKHAGKYSCTASNIEGDGLASSVDLDIKYAPVCAPHQVTTYGVAKKEDAEVTCEVNANPPSKSFKWTFNNTADTIDVPPGRYTTTPESSIITYTPVTELDFGTLLCWAANEIGVQVTPCLFHIVPAGRPDPPTNCSIVNKTSVSFGVWCQKGFDGGLHQVFLLRVSKAGGKGVNYTHGEPSFKVTSLSSGSSYRLQLWAANDKGSSVPVHLNAFTLNTSPNNPSHGPSEAEVREGSVIREASGNLNDSPESEEKYTKDNGIHATQDWEWNFSGIIPLVAGAIAGCILILLVTAIIIRHKLKKVRETHTLDNEDNNSSNSNVCQSSAASMLLHVRHPDGSVVCDKRELQLEPDDTFEREHLTNLDVDASGPLIKPPSTYAEEETRGCYRHHSLEAQGGSPHHSLISHLHEKGGTVTFHSSTANLGSQCYTTHHPHPPQSQVHQHIIQRHHLNNKTPDFNSLDMRAPVLATSCERSSCSNDVPTVCATLGTRRGRSQNHMLRNAQSHVSINTNYEHRLSPSQSPSPCCSSSRYPGTAKDVVLRQDFFVDQDYRNKSSTSDISRSLDTSNDKKSDKQESSV